MNPLFGLKITKDRLYLILDLFLEIGRDAFYEKKRNINRQYGFIVLHTFPVFKSGLKTHLFRQAFDSCDIH